MGETLRPWAKRWTLTGRPKDMSIVGGNKSEV
jgi:hypothetical protein